jgi:hypothetical protein
MCKTPVPLNASSSILANLRLTNPQIIHTPDGGCYRLGAMSLTEMDRMDMWVDNLLANGVDAIEPEPDCNDDDAVSRCAERAVVRCPTFLRSHCCALPSSLFTIPLCMSGGGVTAGRLPGHHSYQHHHPPTVHTYPGQGHHRVLATPTHGTPKGKWTPCDWGWGTSDDHRPEKAGGAASLQPGWTRPTTGLFSQVRVRLEVYL